LFVKKSSEETMEVLGKKPDNDSLEIAEESQRGEY
jgi:hypothetical protein